MSAVLRDVTPSVGNLQGLDGAPVKRTVERHTVGTRDLQQVLGPACDLFAYFDLTARTRLELHMEFPLATDPHREASALALFPGVERRLAQPGCEHHLRRACTEHGVDLADEIIALPTPRAWSRCSSWLVVAPAATPPSKGDDGAATKCTSNEL
jgi:hypothetical protein